jgi:hypothetical protein
MSWGFDVPHFRKVLVHEAGFGISVGEIVRDIQGFVRGERSSIGGHFVMGGYGYIMFYEMETQAAACGSFPAEIFMDYVMFATTEDRDPQVYFPYEPRSFSLRVHLPEPN